MSQSHRILAVDDEVRGVELVARSLRKMAEVESATSGEEAWEMFQRQHYDLVISDQRMPGLTGVELFERIAERASGTGRILLTGYTDSTDAIGAINRGRVHAYLSKPCPPEQLRLTVGSVLEWAGVQRENRKLAAELRERQAALEVERLSGLGAFLSRIAVPMRHVLDGDIDAQGGLDGLRALCADLEQQVALLANPACLEFCDFDAVVGDAARERIAAMGDAGVSCALDLASKTSFAFDAAGIRRVVGELVENAVSAGEGQAKLRLRTETRDDEVALIVSDEGAGVPGALRQLLFEAFISGAPGQRAGLGLTLVGKVARDHGGRVEVAETVGSGSEFVLTLPVRDATTQRTDPQRVDD